MKNEKLAAMFGELEKAMLEELTNGNVDVNEYGDIIFNDISPRLVIGGHAAGLAYFYACNNMDKEFVPLLEKAGEVAKKKAIERLQAEIAEREKKIVELKNGESRI